MFVGYVRVSTQEQSLQLQLDALEAAGCEKIFEKTASGAQRDRPKLQAALDYARPGDCLVVWKLDRLAQSLKQLIETVERLGEQAIGFRSLTERIDTTTAGGKLTFHLFGALAEFARGIIREGTLAGLDAARAQGRVPGRPRALNRSDLAAVRTLLANPKIPVAEIARRLNVDPSTLYRHFPGGRWCSNSLLEAPRKRRYACAGKDAGMCTDARKLESSDATCGSILRLSTGPESSHFTTLSALFLSRGSPEPPFDFDR